jgi:hypothetical protein
MPASAVFSPCACTYGVPFLSSIVLLGSLSPCWVVYETSFLLSHCSLRASFSCLCVLQGLKLSACGQELGGDMLFGRRIGFSGTPSDILPLELGSCQYERGSDGRVVHYLTSPSIVQHVPIRAGWNSHLLLEFIARVSAHRCARESNMLKFDHSVQSRSLAPNSGMFDIIPPNHVTLHNRLILLSTRSSTPAPSSPE